MGFSALDIKRLYDRMLIARHSPKAADLKNDGIGIVAEIKYICSLSQLARDFVTAISQTDVPFSLLDASIPLPGRKSIAPAEKAFFRKLACTSFNQRHVIRFSTIPCYKDKRFCTAITPFWEFSSGMLEHRRGLFDGADAVIAYSDFLKSYYESIAPSGLKILKFHYPYFPTHASIPDKSTVRNDFNLPQNSFISFFNFDFGSSYARKNPEAALLAFSEAFSSPSDDSLFVFKTSHAPEHPNERKNLAAFAKKCGIERRVRFFDDYLPRKDLLALTSACDAYISLHRGEGLGMGMLEAMTLNVPVVATDYGGNTDFVRPDTAFPVPYKLVAAKPDIPAYEFVAEWAEPDTSAAASALRQIRDNPAVAAAKTSAASSLITRQFSMASFTSDLQTFMEM